MITICGTGLAGLRIAAELRERGYDGLLRAIEREGIPPYDRPPLTKVLFGEYRKPLSAEGLGELSQLCDEVITANVESLDGTAVIANGTRYESDITVLALGADARNAIGGALTIRTRDDAAKLRAVEGQVTIVGGGWLGCELASSYAEAGRQVNLVEIAEDILPVLGPGARKVRVALEDLGVKILRQIPDNPGTLVEATGAIPNTLGLDLTTDGWGRTNMPGVYAVGDCAEISIGPSSGHWNTALHQATRVAEAIMTDPHADPVPLTPDVFSTIAGLELLFIGHAAGTPVVLEDGSRTLWIKDGRLSGGLTIDRPADGVALRKNIGASLSEEAAADPLPLKKILRAQQTV